MRRAVGVTGTGTRVGRPQRRVALWLGAALVGARLAVAWGPEAAWAAVPPSVAVRTQEPAVEAVIQALEAQVAGYDGLWQLRSGRQDAPATGWKLGRQGTQWYLQADAVPPAPQAGTLLYSDGTDSYLLPQALHLQHDALQRGQYLEARLGLLLLQATVLPRSFLGSLGGLKVVGEETLEGGGKVLHLQADPRRDELALKDPAVAGRSPLPTWDLYYDPQRQAVVKLSLQDPNGYRYESTVTAWDPLGTRRAWPQRLTGQTFLAQGAPGAAPQPVDKPVLTEVLRLTPGADASFARVQAQIQQTPFFSAPPTDLRSGAFYQQELAVHPQNLTARVERAQAAFLQADLVEGLKQWQEVEKTLTAPDQRQRLLGVLVLWAGPALPRATTTGQPTAAVVDVLGRLQRDLNPTVYAAYSPALCRTWELLWRDPKTRPAVAGLQPALLDRLARQGQSYVFAHWLKLAQESPEAAPLLEPYLTLAATLPLGEAGYHGSPLSYLTQAALQQGDLVRARKVLEHPAWAPQTPPEAQQFVSLLGQAITLRQELAEAKVAAWGPALQTYHDLAAPAWAAEVGSVQAAQELLVGAATQVVQTGLTDPQSGLKPTELITSSGATPGAQEFWPVVLLRLTQAPYSRGPQWNVRQVGPLVKRFGQVGQMPALESQFYLQLAQDPKGEFPGIDLDYLAKALAAAPTDRLRVQVLRQIAQVYLRNHQFAQARQAVEGARSLVQDPAQNRELDAFVATFAAQEEGYQQSVAKQAARDQETRRRGQVAYLQERLTQAQQRGSSPEEIARLQRLVKAAQEPPAGP